MGITFGHGLSPSETLLAAESCERYGFDSILVSESTGADSLSILGAIAARTNTIKIGSGIVNVYSRSPVQLAMAAATLHNLSKGRFFLGIGASSKGVVENWHGLEYTRQFEKTREAIETIREKLGKNDRGGAPPQQLALLGLGHHPLSDIPVILAAVGDRMVLLAKEKCDGVLFFMRPFSRLKEDVESLVQGGSSSRFSVNSSVPCCVSSSSEVAENRVRHTIAFYLTYGQAYRGFIEKNLSAKFSQDTSNAIRDSWLKGKREEASRLVPRELLDELAIYGTARECATKISEEFAKLQKDAELSTLYLQFNQGEKTLEGSLHQFSEVAVSLVGR